MTDIKSPQLLYLKGALMLLTGILASVLLISQNPSLQSIALLMIAIWGFCRAYYFAFYVIEHYIDPGYRFAGLTDFLRYSLRKRESGSNTKLHSQSTIEPQDRSIEHRVLKNSLNQSCKLLGQPKTFWKNARIEQRPSNFVRCCLHHRRVENARCDAHNTDPKPPEFARHR